MNVNARASRCTAVVIAGLAATMGVTASIGAAGAAPPNDGGQPSCIYTLSAPFVLEVTGIKMVSATLTAYPCAGHILPNSKTVCIELQGAGNPPLCAYQGGPDAAQVYFAPYRPGSTYVSTGTGCGAVAPAMVSVCATQGPRSATL